MIRPTVRRLPRSPRFRVRVPIVDNKLTEELRVFVASRLRRGNWLREARNDLAKLAEDFNVVLVEVAGETVILQEPLDIATGHHQPEVIGPNRAVGGAPASKHMQGTAFDIAMANHDPAAFEAAARAVGFLGFGYYPRSGFMHIDLGPARSWGDPFPARPVPFAPELPPAREVLAESRTLRGGGAADAATVGAAGVEVLQDVLAETQSTIQPLVPYLDTLRWVLIAIALIGIAVTIHARLDDWKRGQR